MSTQDAPERATPRLDFPAPRVLVIQAAYYEGIVHGMRDGVLSVLEEAGVPAEVVDVAGAFELPAALRLAMLSGLYGGYVVLGCVLRGETDHYDHICREACRGIMDLTIETAASVGFALLTVETMAQAEARSRPDRFNKGAEAARAMLMQLVLARRLAREVSRS